MHIKRFTPTYILWHAYNLFAAQLMPGSFDGVGVPVWWGSQGNSGFVLPVAGFILLLAAFGLATAVVFRRKAAWRPYRKIATIIGVFVLFQGIVFLFHNQILVSTGYYYGSIFSVLFATLMAIIFFDLSTNRPRVIQWMAYVLIAHTLIASTSNFITLDRSWIRHSNFKAVYTLPLLPFFGRFGSWEQLKELKTNDWPFYTDEAYIPPGETAFGDALAIWQKWRRGDPELLGRRDVHVRDIWILAELTRIRGN